VSFAYRVEGRLRPAGPVQTRPEALKRVRQARAKTDRLDARPA
jgi:hypothetical protein